MVYMMQSIVKQDQLVGLWRGTQATVLRVGLGAGSYFVILDL